MLSNNEYSPYLGLLSGFQSNSKNPFVNMFSNLARMQMLQNMYAPQNQQAQQNIAQDYNALPMQNQQTVNQPSTAFNFGDGINQLTQGVNSAVNNFTSGSSDMVSRIANAIGMVESSNNYKALGPQTKSGDRAYGKYQVMGNNVPSWTKEVLGQSMTPQQFLASQEAQDRVAMAKMGQYYNKYQSPHDVASMWFSGRPAQNNWRKDITGTSVPEYMKRVIKYMG